NPLLDVIDVRIELGQQNQFSPTADSAVEGDEARIGTHDFDQKDPVVRVGGVANPVDVFDGRIQRGIEPDRLVGPEEVIVNRCRASDNQHRLFLRQQPCAGKRTVAPDYYQRVDVCAFECLG